MITPMPIVIPSGGGDINTDLPMGLVMFLAITGLLFIFYVGFYFIEAYKDQAKTRKQFILQFLIPFYWWGYIIKEWIKEAIKDYKELDK